jgi:hypothetical protein
MNPVPFDKVTCDKPKFQKFNYAQLDKKWGGVNLWLLIILKVLR